jgi:hypothetical protein
VHKNSALFFGTAKESDQGDAGVQSIGSAVVDVTPGDYFELVARQTSPSTKNVAADELTWFAIEVVAYLALCLTRGRGAARYFIVAQGWAT